MSTEAKVSADGSVVAFRSRASNLVAGDTNGVVDIFARDLASRVTERISVTSAEEEVTSSGEGNAARATISRDGRLIGFDSEARVLTGLGFEQRQVFLRDRIAGTTTQVSTTSDGTAANASSSEVFLAADGEWIVFGSEGSNLVAGDSNGLNDVFLKNLATGAVERANVASDGGQANGYSNPLDVSADGRFVLFLSLATNLASPGVGHVYLRDRLAGTTERVSQPIDCAATQAGFTSDDGRWIGLRVSQCPGGSPRVVMVDRQTASHTTIAGMFFVLDLSADGRYLLTHSNAHTHRYDRVTGTTSMVATFTVHTGAISDSGDSIVYLGLDGQLPGDSNGITDVFVRQLAAETVPDTVPPVVVGVPDRPPNAAGWYDADVTIDWTEADPDPSSGPPTDPPDTVAALEGAHIYTSAPSCDPAGNCATGGLALNLDKTPPVLGVPNWSTNPLGIGGTTTLTVPAADVTAGVTGGEYFLGADPGPGNGASMTWDGANLGATFGASLHPGVHTVGLRARDVAGNWSAVIYNYLVVFDPAGPSDVAGKKSLVPQYQFDVLPYLTHPDQTDEVHFGIAVRYLAGGQVDPTSQFSFTYYVGFAGNKNNNCKLPNPADCHSTDFAATGVSWLTINGTNNSVGTFQGVGTLTIDGLTTTNPFRVVATDGSRLTPTSGDNVALFVYAPGADPSNDPPLYHLAGAPSGHGIDIL